MKKITAKLAVTAISLALFVSACAPKSKLPQNPQDKEEYKDEEGNRWVYHSNGNFWMVYALMNSMRNSSSAYASSPSYRYYPDLNSWTNGTGTTKVNPEAGLASTAARSYRNSTTSVKTETPKTPRSKSFKIKSSSHSFGA